MPLDKDKKREEFKRLRAMLKEREASGLDAPVSDTPPPGQAGPSTRDSLRRIVGRHRAEPPTPMPTADPALGHTGRTPITYSRNVPRNPRSPRTPGECNGPIISLSDAVPGTEHTRPDASPCYLVTQQVREQQRGDELNDRFETQVTDPASELTLRVAQTMDLRGLSPEDFVFMDIESTGLSSTPVFLIGVMIWESGGLVVKQYLAPHYGEERALLAAFCDVCGSRGILVTFNGKSFDVPFIRTRCAATGTPFSMELPHLDLLHLSRRVWKGRLPNCKLQTLEWHVCQRMRYDDIPGSEIPDAYHAFVRSGNAGQIATILKHNKLDLITLADLMTRFPDEC